MAKSKYETLVKPNFERIKSLVDEGATDKEIIDFIGVSKDAFYRYMRDNKEFYDLMRGSRPEKIQQLKESLFKKAIGFQYQETREIIDANGETKIERYTKTCLPSETAILILLKHWDKEKDGTPKWMNDPATFKLKLKELELKEKQAEEGQW